MRLWPDDDAATKLLNGRSSTSADIVGNDDEIIVGAKYGFATLNRKTSKLRYIKKLWTDQDGQGKAER